MSSLDSFLKNSLTYCQQVEGILDTSFSGGGSRSIKVINDSHTLWSQPPSQAPCLPQVPFSVVLPYTFQDGGKPFPLPPSYYFFQQVVQSLLVRTTYQLHFIVTRIRHQKLDIWPKKQQYVYLLAFVRVTLTFICLSQHYHPFQICTPNTGTATYSHHPLLFLIRQNGPRGMASGSNIPRDAPKYYHKPGYLPCMFLLRTLAPSDSNILFLISSSSPLVEYMVLQTP